ncbi:MAG: signal peptidase I [Chloroflexota bacterium]
MHIEEDKYWHSDPRLPEPVDPGEDGGSTDPEGGPELTGGGSNRHVFREIVETVLVTLLIFFVVRAVIQNFKVEGDSMLPTLHSEQYLLVNKGLYFRYDANFLVRLFNSSAPEDMRYLFHGPQRGDILVFESPTEPRDFIKRVVAVEGETVEVKADPDSTGRPGDPCGDCGVYVDGVRLDEPYVKATPDYVQEPIVVPPGTIYVLGDNRRNSSDSHVWGPLDVNKIVGIAFLSYWPTNHWGFLPHPTYAEIKKGP